MATSASLMVTTLVFSTGMFGTATVTQCPVLLSVPAKNSSDHDTRQNHACCCSRIRQPDARSVLLQYVIAMLPRYIVPIGTMHPGAKRETLLRVATRKARDRSASFRISSNREASHPRQARRPTLYQTRFFPRHYLVRRLAPDNIASFLPNSLQGISMASQHKRLNGTATATDATASNAPANNRFKEGHQSNRLGKTQAESPSSTIK